MLQLFANTGGRSGNFSAVNATGLAPGQSATFNPATGFITVVPEPSTCAMALAGLACGGYTLFRRRRGLLVHPVSVRGENRLSCQCPVMDSNHEPSD